MGNRYYRSVENQKTANERSATYIKRHPERRRSTMLKCKYGITLVQWNELFDCQANACAICRTKEVVGRHWHTDHDHETGVVRGILCNNCNVGLGYFKDNPVSLVDAANYLRAHSKKGLQ